MCLKWADMWLKKINSKQDTDEMICSQSEFAALTIQLKYTRHFFSSAFKTHSFMRCLFLSVLHFQMELQTLGVHIGVGIPI